MTNGHEPDHFQRLLLDARAGQQHAYRTLYEQFAGRIRAFALVRRSSDPDGVANDVMLRAFRHLDRFVGDERAFMSWLFQIARNRMIDQARANARRPVTGSSDPGAHLPVVPSAEEQALEVRSLDDALSLLDQLTEDQREVIAMRLIGDLSLEQVSNATGRPVTAVKALQRRGIARLRRVVADKEVL